MADDSFIKSINDSDAGQLLSFAGNFSGTVQGIAAFISLFQQSDTSQILNAIDQLRQDLERDFRTLGDLITQQTQIVVDTVNRDTMALALSRSDIATNRIQEFLSTSDSQALETAKTESIGGVRFFTELGTNAPDLAFFLPGIIKAGTIRLFVIAAEPLSLREPRAVVVDDVNLMITFLASMIDATIRKVDAAHTVRVRSHSIQCPPNPQIRASSTQPQQIRASSNLPHRIVHVIDGYSHEENGVQIQFFDAQQGNPLPCEQPSGGEQTALAAASQARNQGVTDELAFIGIPGFKQILQQWRNFLMS